MQHMVMKHGSQFDSYFEHITYPLTLYSGVCSGAACATAGRYAAYSAALAKVQPVWCFFFKENYTGLRVNMCKKHFWDTFVEHVYQNVEMFLANWALEVQNSVNMT